MAFFIGAVGTLIGTVVAFAAVGPRLGPDGYKLAAALCASYIGGSANFAAVSRALGLAPGPALASAMTADNCASRFYLPAPRWMLRKGPWPALGCAAHRRLLCRHLLLQWQSTSLSSCRYLLLAAATVGTAGIAWGHALRGGRLTAVVVVAARPSRLRAWHCRWQQRRRPARWEAIWRPASAQRAAGWQPWRWLHLGLQCWGPGWRHGWVAAAAVENSRQRQRHLLEQRRWAVR